MDDETKKSLDSVVKRLQSIICVEYKKVGAPDEKKVNDYLQTIWIINQELGTNYSVHPKRYDINKLPLED